MGWSRVPWGSLPIPVEGAMPFATQAGRRQWVARKMEALRQAFGGRCAWCGAREALEFAHVQPTPMTRYNNGYGRGSLKRYYDIRKHPHAYLLLCDPCHVAQERQYRGGDQLSLGLGK